MTPWVRRLIVINLLVFLATWRPGMGVHPAAAYWLGFKPALVLFMPWTLLTYMFVHANFMHIFFNMLVLFFFGPRLEDRLGSRRFLWLYLLSGFSGAVLSFLTPFANVIGASGATFGVLLGFARFWPRAQIFIWGILPIEARWFVIVLTGISLFLGFGGAGGVAHFAHLGGFGGAFLYLRWLEHRSGARQFRKKMYRDVPQGPVAETRAAERWRHIPLDDLHEINRDEVVRLQRKAVEKGVGSLTLDERAFLDRFS